MPDESDHELLRAYAARGSEGAFQILEGRYSGLVYGTAMRRLGCHALAAEVTQDVFLLLSERAGRLDAVTLPGWLHRCALLKAGDALKRERRHQHRVREFARLHSGPEPGDVLAAQRLSRLDSAIDQLSGEDREIIFLRYFEGLKNAETALRLGVDPEAAQKRCERARARLARLLVWPALGALAAEQVLAAQLQEWPGLHAGPSPFLPSAVVKSGTRSFWLRRLGWVGLGTAVVASVAVLALTAGKHSAPAEAGPRAPDAPRPAVLRSTAARPAVAQPKQGTTLDLERLAVLFEKLEDGDAAAATELDRLLVSTDAAALQSAMARIPALQLPLNQLRLLALGLMGRLVPLDGRRAVLVGEQIWNAFAGSSAPALCGQVAEGLKNWSRIDEPGARGWISAVQKQAAEGRKQQAFFEAVSTAVAGAAAAPPEEKSDEVPWDALHARDRESVTLEARRNTALLVMENPAHWAAMTELWANNLPWTDATALADDLFARAAVMPDRLAAAIQFRIALVAVPGRPPSKEVLEWAASAFPALPAEEIRAAVIQAWTLRDASGTAAWLAALPAGEDHEALAETFFSTLLTIPNPNPSSHEQNSNQEARVR